MEKYRIIYNKTLVIGILSLFLGMIFTPDVSSVKINQKTIGNIIIVDDEGDGDYTSIQDAVNRTTDGDIILVYSGTYSQTRLRNCKGITIMEFHMS